MGKTDQHHMSHQIKSNFYHHSHKDEQTGELFMTEDDFINAVAPKQEDYVSVCPPPGWLSQSVVAEELIRMIFP